MYPMINCDQEAGAATASSASTLLATARLTRMPAIIAVPKSTGAPIIPHASSTGRQPLVNEKDAWGVSTIVHNQPARHRLAGVDSLGDGSMPLPLPVPPNSATESEVARKVLPRDRTSAVTALFEEHYASLVRMARLLVDDRETAEDVVMDAFTSLYQRWTGVRNPDEAYRTCAPASSTAPEAN